MRRASSSSGGSGSSKRRSRGAAGRPTRPPPAPRPLLLLLGGSGSSGSRGDGRTGAEHPRPRRRALLVRASASASLPLSGSSGSSSSSSGSGSGSGSSGGGGSGGGDPSAAERAAYARDTFARMARFCGPALLVPMSDPLMGFCDVVCVGQFASTAELSALGPATLALSFATYAFQAVQVATLALVSERLRARDAASAQRALSAALWVALAAGALVALPLAFVPGCASAVVGATGCDALLRPPAEAYVRIRALGLPVVLATMVSQAAMLAQRDSATPACAVALGVAVNVAGNLVAVAWLKMGLAGAAVTTVLTQAAGAAALAGLMWRQRRAGESALAGLLPRWRPSRRRSGDEGDGGDDGSGDDELASPPMPPLRPVPRFPTRADAAALAFTVGPLSVSYICRNACYLALQGAAAGLDVTRLAAHQATFSAWAILSFVSSPVEQSALAFVPAAAAQAAAADQEKEEAAAAARRRGQQQQQQQQAAGAADGGGVEQRDSVAEDAPAPPPPSSSSSSWWRVDVAVRLVLRNGLAMGLTCGALAAAIPSLAPRLFTPDASVWPFMASVAPQAFLSMVLIGVDVASAGCLLAGRDLAYVARSYVVTLAVLYGAVLGPWRLASTLPGVWWCLVLFFSARALQSTGRLAWLMRRRELVGGLQRRTAAATAEAAAAAAAGGATA